MAALGLSEQAAKQAISEIGGWLEIAAINGPSAVTVAGDENALAKLVDKVTQDGQFARVLKLEYPFHTKAMETTKDNLLSALAGLSPATCQIPFISTVTGEKVDGQTLDAHYWFDNVRQPVNFVGAVSKVLSDFDVDLFIEVGPHPVLKDYIDQTAKAEGAMATSFGTLRCRICPSTNGSANATGAGRFLCRTPLCQPKKPTQCWVRVCRLQTGLGKRRWIRMSCVSSPTMWFRTAPCSGPDGSV